MSCASSSLTEDDAHQMICRLGSSLALLGDLLSLQSRLQGWIRSWTTLQGFICTKPSRFSLALSLNCLSTRLRGIVHVYKA